MTGDVELSVVVPCYNAADTLGEQLEALAGQRTPVRWEVVVADNGSTDDSRAVAGRFAPVLPDLRVVDASAHRGASHAYNAGALQARGRIVLFCDADDVVADGWLEALRTAMEDTDLVGGRLDGTLLNPGWRASSRGVPQLTGPQRGPDGLVHFGSGNLGVRRAAFLAVGGFDEHLTVFGDTDLCWRMQQAGSRPAYAPAALVHVRLRRTLSAGFAQAVSYGAAEEQLAALHPQLRAGGRLQHAVRVSVLSWAAALLGLARVRGRADLAGWSWLLGWRIGRCRGWWRFRWSLARTPRRLLTPSQPSGAQPPSPTRAACSPSTG